MEKLILLTGFQRPQMACSLQPEFFYLSLCKSSSSLLPFNSYLPSQASPFSCPRHVLKPSLSRLLVANPSPLSPVALRCCSSRHGTPKETIKLGRNCKIRPVFSPSWLDNKRVQGNLAKTSDSVTVKESAGKELRSDGKTNRRLDSANRTKNQSGFSSDRAKTSNSDTNSLGLLNAEVDNGKIGGKTVKETKGKKWKWSKKSKANPVDTRVRVKLEMCSKAGDVMGAISLYDSATREGVKLGQYHYTMLLYLCSSAAMGVVQPAKSGSGSRSVDMLVPSSKGSSLDSVNGSITGETNRVAMGLSEENFDNEEKSESQSSEGETEDDEDEGEDEVEDEDDVYDDMDTKEQFVKQKKAEIRVSEPVKKYALERGFEIYERMCLEHIPMNEAALTSVARMAMATGDGDKAFDMVKQMKALGINPKLRSYGPALSVFCTKGEVDKAFEVEKHMLDHGVQPEEPELEALLRVSINVGKSDKIYYLLHKLRTTVRSASPSTANLIEKWFGSKEASRVGKRKWDPKLIAQTTESVGGGWHGQGWLGNGKWIVSHTVVEADGLCKCCGQKLALIDLDPEETEKFAESVAAIASKREKNSSFQKFQRWLDYYGPFEAIVDAANVGLFSQKKFKLSKVKAVVNGIRQTLTSKKWPLVVLHNRRITDPKINEPVNRAIIERWKNADALYATPTGSNDDWYWLYAAIKFKSLIVTNDEMRDHIFQLLGNGFFPRWKERHQVRFSFSEVGPVFHMPPLCSVVIQESERGHWHIPIASEHQSGGERTWLCIKRMKSPSRMKDSKTEDEVEDEQRSVAKQAQETYGSKMNTIEESVSLSFRSILRDIQSAEEQSGSVIDFQI